VVHHIFPRVPRHNLPEVKRRLQKMCKEHGLVYKSVGWLEGNRYVCVKREEERENERERENGLVCTDNMTTKTYSYVRHWSVYRSLAWLEGTWYVCVESET